MQLFIKIDTLKLIFSNNKKGANGTESYSVA